MQTSVHKIHAFNPTFLIPECKRRLYSYKLGTLGDPSAPTCSEYVARAVCKFKHVQLYGSFEKAASDVVLGSLDIFLVPAAYPHVCHFIHSAELRLLALFVTRIPPMVVAGTLEQMPDQVDVLYHHPATAAMLAQIGCKFSKVVTVASNVAACRAVTGDADKCVCITNKLAADKFNLRISSVLRPGTPMPFFVFGAARLKHANN